MKTCFNHPDKKALAICHGCGRDYCEDCLDEGNEYYYCRRPECQDLRMKELSAVTGSDNTGIEPDIKVCPNCGAELALTEVERKEGKVHCPECEASVDFKSDPPKVLQRENYVELLSSLNQGDISLLKSILDDGEIDYYVFGENTLSMQPFLFPVRFFVNEDQLEKAKELLKDFEPRIWGPSANR